MYIKQELNFLDFKKHEIWTEDEARDDGSFIPLEDISYYQNGELDAGPLFVKGSLTLADKSTHDVIVGISQKEKFEEENIIYFFEAYCISLENTIFHLFMEGLSDITDHFNKTKGQVFPACVKAEVKKINLSLSQRINY